MEKKTGPPAKALESVDAAKAFADEHDVVVVGFFKVNVRWLLDKETLDTTNPRHDKH